MNDLQERNVCRLCLKAAFGYCLSITEEIASDISDVLLSYLDFHISDNPVMCKQCEEHLHKAVGFKSSRKMLPSIYIEELEPTDTILCNFCISYPPVQVRPVPDADYNVFLLQIIRELSTKLKRVSTDNSVACEDCFCIIQDILQFTETCLNAEDKIRRYIEVEGLNPNGQVDLDDVQTFEAKSMKWSFNDTKVKEVDATKTISEKNEINCMNYTNINSMEVDKIDGTNEESKLEVMNNFSVKEEREHAFEVSEENKIEIGENENVVTLAVNNSTEICSIPTENSKTDNIEEIYVKNEEVAIKSEDDFDSVVSNPVPEKSRRKYLQAFERYEKWCTHNTICDITEEKALLVYFDELSKTQKPPSLWCHFSMLRAEILLRRNVELKKCKNLLAFLKRNAKGYTSEEKSKTFTKKQIATFLLIADDRKFLCMKVILIIGLVGACRREELANLLVENVRDEGFCFHIKIPNSKSKGRREFFVTAGDIGGLNYVEIIRRYIKLRPENCNHERFFVRYKAYKCMKRPVGINTIGSIPKVIAQYLRLDDPKAYTGHCFRRSSKLL